MRKGKKEEKTGESNGVRESEEEEKRRGGRRSKEGKRV